MLRAGYATGLGFCEVKPFSVIVKSLLIALGLSYVVILIIEECLETETCKILLLSVKFCLTITFIALLIKVTMAGPAA
jgi:hypothetical protein